AARTIACAAEGPIRSCAALASLCGSDFGVSLVFFFQAEDGIRDDLVTGVQTCALPICDGPSAACAGRSTCATSAPRTGDAAGGRSEERRVGKECGCGGWRCD